MKLNLNIQIIIYTSDHSFLPGWPSFSYLFLLFYLTAVYRDALSLFFISFLSFIISFCKFSIKWSLELHSFSVYQINFDSFSLHSCIIFCSRFLSLLAHPSLSSINSLSFSKIFSSNFFTSSFNFKFYDSQLDISEYLLPFIEVVVIFLLTLYFS